MILKRLLARRFAQSSECMVDAGERIYAIGDIHGRLDLLDRLLELIAEDTAKRAPSKISLVFLGDLVNRGGQSKGVIDRLVALNKAGPNLVFLKGNHEEILINAYKGDRRSARLLHRVGGRQTLISYGVSPVDYDQSDLSGLGSLINQNVPKAHIDFLEGFRDWYGNGDYFFVHAGIRPGTPLDQQKASDLRWIRREFLESQQHHGKMIIHGHNITESVDEQRNRIGIDTGAYLTGQLTAIGLEGASRWYLSTATSNTR